MRKVMWKANALLEPRGIFICHADDPIIRNITIRGGNFTTKQSDYITFHGVDIINGTPDPQYAVYIPDASGLTDIEAYEA